MKLCIPFQVINWDQVPEIQYPGTTGETSWKTLQYEGLRVRIVTYSKGYLADHWCRKGHIVHCLEGAFETQMEDGTSYLLSKGMSYIVTDELSSHRSVSSEGVKLLIIDGDFLS